MIQEYGFFALDPGLSSAMAWGITRDEKSVARRIAAIHDSGSDTLIEPNWLLQGRIISQRVASFRTYCHKKGLPTYFVCEDFILKAFKTSERAQLYPVWVAAAVMGYRQGISDAYEAGGFGPTAPVEAVWQQPSQAKTYATDERLRRWGYWIRGKEHERDAWRHAILFIASQRSTALRLARARGRSSTTT